MDVTLDVQDIADAGQSCATIVTWTGDCKVTISYGAIISSTSTVTHTATATLHQ
jgi:hypothetical protein